MTQHQGDQQAPHPAIAVQEWVDGLELRVREARPQEHRQPGILLVEESFQIGHAVGNRVGRRRDESRRSGPPAPDPVLRAPELARRLVAAPAA